MSEGEADNRIDGPPPEDPATPLEAKVSVKPDVGFPAAFASFLSRISSGSTMPDGSGSAIYEGMKS